MYARGNRRQPVFVDRGDREAYLTLLGRAVSRMGWRCLAYCLMDNHVHLVVETPQPNLGRGMQWLHGSYARFVNRRHGLSGHLFQGRYGSVRVTDDPQLFQTLRYLALNPVDAGITLRPEDYAWSSHGAVLLGEAPPFVDVRRLLSYFAALGGDPRARYASFIADLA